jgi:hypothetical protein
LNKSAKVGLISNCHYGKSSFRRAFMESAIEVAAKTQTLFSTLVAPLFARLAHGLRLSGISGRPAAK